MGYKNQSRGGGFADDGGQGRSGRTSRTGGSRGSGSAREALPGFRRLGFYVRRPGAPGRAGTKKGRGRPATRRVSRPVPFAIGVARAGNPQEDQAVHRQVGRPLLRFRCRDSRPGLRANQGRNGGPRKQGARPAQERRRSQPGERTTGGGSRTPVAKASAVIKDLPTIRNLKLYRSSSTWWTIRSVSSAQPQDSVTPEPPCP